MKLAALSVVLFIVFLVLRLTETIMWSYWWVTSPLWIYGVLFVIAAIVFVALSKRIMNWQNKKIKKWLDNWGV
jgi:cell division protein FtsW (lipid II flippase)